MKQNNKTINKDQLKHVTNKLILAIKPDKRYCFKNNDKKSKIHSDLKGMKLTSHS